MQQALERLAAGGVDVLQVSPVYENRAIGMGEAAPFLNAVAAVATGLAPLALLDHCLAVEQTLGRVRTEQWAPRTIDLDVIAYGELELVSERLQVPHPRIEQRDFVVHPLALIAPDLMIRGRRVADLAADLPADGLTLSGDSLQLPA
ncbi:MAG: 2-amino-4-hydroxy-6-hydroxymethyldihydropteridine diphosphokinase [Puniceicoccaceae bacterium]|nr:MAG: 2-amino-4-hydroxy-6-hydroxymethyldihydropteridine diphosphokinase [Puniceicoccaceae bacterium]